MTYEEIFTQTKEMIEAADVSDVKGHLAIEIDIVGEGEGAFYIELRDGKAIAMPYEYYDHDCKFLISGKDFLAICDGSLNAVMAFTVGKLKIEGSIEKALEFSEIVDHVKATEKQKAKVKKTPARKKKAE